MKLEDAQAKIRSYEKDHTPVGEFLTAILTNNLADAFRKADPESLGIIPELVKFCWNELPSNIWGSAKAVENHLLHGSMAEQIQEAASQLQVPPLTLAQVDIVTLVRYTADYANSLVTIPRKDQIETARIFLQNNHLEQLLH